VIQTASFQTSFAPFNGGGSTVLRPAAQVGASERPHLRSIELDRWRTSAWLPP